MMKLEEIGYENIAGGLAHPCPLKACLIAMAWHSISVM